MLSSRQLFSFLKISDPLTISFFFFRYQVMGKGQELLKSALRRGSESSKDSPKSRSGKETDDKRTGSTTSHETASPPTLSGPKPDSIDTEELIENELIRWVNTVSWIPDTPCQSSACPTKTPHRAGRFNVIPGTYSGRPLPPIEIRQAHQILAGPKPTLSARRKVKNFEKVHGSLTS